MSSTPQLYNSAVESGLRALCVLVETYPGSCDLQRLILFDYLLVHSADVNSGPESLHPAIPQRGTEVIVRRAILKPGLALYARRGLISTAAEHNGFTYSASDRGSAFLDTLRAGYLAMLRDRARWISTTFGKLSTGEIHRYVNTELDRWGGQFAEHEPERGGE